MATIELMGVSKVFKVADSEIHAVNDVNLTFRENEFAVLAGPSGSGKTTLLNIIGTLEKVTCGSVICEGKDLSTMNQNQLADFRFQNIGFIFQAFNLIPTLNIADNILLGLAVGNRRLRKSLKTYQDEIDRMISLVGLDDWRNHKPAQLSGGQQQRVAIARALIKKPAVVLADEPTANLDKDNAQSIMQLMKNLNENLGTSFIISTHDGKLQNQVNRIIFLEDGQIIKEERKMN